MRSQSHARSDLGATPKACTPNPRAMPRSQTSCGTDHTHLMDTLISRSQPRKNRLVQASLVPLVDTEYIFPNTKFTSNR